MSAAAVRHAAWTLRCMARPYHLGCTFNGLATAARFVEVAWLDGFGGGPHEVRAFKAQFARAVARLKTFRPMAGRPFMHVLSIGAGGTRGIVPTVCYGARDADGARCLEFRSQWSGILTWEAKRLAAVRAGLGDWFLTRITKSADCYYRLHVAGYNLCVPYSDNGFRFSWNVRDVADPRYTISAARVDPKAVAFLGRGGK